MKLSDAQNKALNEISQKGETSARSNTIQSLIEKELVSAVSREEFGFDFELTTKGRAQLGLPSKEEWQGAVSEVEAVQEVMFSPERIDQAIETFEYQLGVYSNTLMGFGDVYKWNNIIVWDGLTLKEIKEDIKTAFPVNRKARREHAKMSRRLIKAAIGAL